jgi:3-methylfumaryl-CoA hydratase
MNEINLAYLQNWVGRETTTHDLLAPRHAGLMAATLGLSRDALGVGAALPPLWHWTYFLEGLPPTELGRDGHPARGGFLPPVPLPNRMWAGGVVNFDAPLPLGAAVEKRSRIASVQHKVGRSGDLVFVTVAHEIWHQGQLALRELHDIVYKSAAPAHPAPPVGADVPTDAGLPISTRTRTYRPDATQLFRYSALTFNGHRIHYDLDYCRGVEGYDNLVIHGPLNATLLAAWAQEVAGCPLREFRYRGLRPALLGQTLTLHWGESADTAMVWVTLESGAVSMQAEALF